MKKNLHLLSNALIYYHLVVRLLILKTNILHYTIIFRKNLQEILCKDLFFPKYNYVPIFIQDLIKTVFCHHG